MPEPLAPDAPALGPLAAVPASRRTRDHPPCAAPCEACGALVLTGCPPSGQRVALDTDLRTYAVDWTQGEPGPGWWRAGGIRCSGARLARGDDGCRRMI
jgi:hypothetical protein